MIVEGERLLIDIDFRLEFEIARSTKSYKTILQTLPHIFVGKPDRQSSTDFYWKDVQKVQPSVSQIYIGFYYIPWILKPVLGLLTDVFPVMGYLRRPYFVVAGVVGAVSAAVELEFELESSNSSSSSSSSSSLT